MTDHLPSVSASKRPLPRLSNGSAGILLSIAATFLVTGWFAAFTTPGLEFILIGTLLAISAVALNRRLRVTVIAGLLLAVAWFLSYIIGGVYCALRFFGV